MTHRVAAFVIAGVAAASFAGVAAAADRDDAADRRGRALAALGGALPHFFEENRGQAPDGFDFLVRCRGYHTFVASGEAVFAFDGRALRMTLEGARASVAPDVRGLTLDARANYFLGNDASKWITGIPLTRGAVYRDVAPGTHWRLGGRDRLFDFALDVPGTDEPRFQLDGWSALLVRDDGTLRVEMPTGAATFTAPLAWQTDSGGARRTVPAAFELDGDGIVRVALGPRDPGRRTTIDPTVSWMSYLGGSDRDVELVPDVAPSGSIRIAGTTFSADFPVTSGAFDTSHGSTTGERSDVLVVEIDPNDGSLAWATFLGSGRDDDVWAIASGESGSVLVGGETRGDDFPSTAGVVGTPSARDAYIARIAADGASLHWSTYLNGYPNPRAMVAGADGQPQFVGEDRVVRLAADASEVELDRVFSASSGATPSLRGIAMDPSGALVVAATGEIARTTGAYAAPNRGGSTVSVLRLEPDGDVVWCAHFGGTRDDDAVGVGLDGADRPVVLGSSESVDLPVTPDAFQASRASTDSYKTDGFLFRLAADGSALRYATYFGGTDWDVPRGVRVHPSGAAFVAGHTDSDDFPVADAFQSSRAYPYDAFVMKIRADGSLAWSSFAGGSGSDGVTGLAIGADGTVAVGGSTTSDDLPTTSPFQDARQGDSDGWFLVIPDTLATAARSPVVTTSSLAGWTQGVAYSESLAATSGTTPYTWNVTAGTLPPGLSLSASGTISGTPSQPSVAAFTVRVVDASGYEDWRALGIVIQPAVAVLGTPPTLWTTGQSFDFAFEGRGGTGAITFDLAAGTLPPGMSFGSDGRLAGAPAMTGTWNFTVRGTDTLGSAASKATTLQVFPRPFVFPRVLPEWTTGQPIVIACQAIGGTGGLTWSLASGSLPAPALDVESGTIGGTAAAPGLHTFTLRATDACGASAETEFRQTINELPSIATTSLAPAALGRPYGHALEFVGGTRPGTWSVIAGALPAGLTLDGNSGDCGGTPTEAGVRQVRVGMRDAAGAADERTLAFDVADAFDLRKKRANHRIVVEEDGAEASTRFFEATAQSKLTVNVRGGGAGTAGPEVVLLGPAGVPLDLGSALRTSARSARIAGLVLPATGRYFLRVRGADGFTGTIRVAIALAPASSFSGTLEVPAPGLGVDVTFAAPPGARASVTVAPAKRSRATPEIAALRGPDGTDLLAGAPPRRKGRSVTAKPRAPLAGGDHVLRIAGAGEGDLVWTVSLKMPKTYGFTLPDVPSGDEP